MYRLLIRTIEGSILHDIRSKVWAEIHALGRQYDPARVGYYYIGNSWSWASVDAATGEWFYP